MAYQWSCNSSTPRVRRPLLTKKSRSSPSSLRQNSPTITVGTRLLPSYSAALATGHQVPTNVPLEALGPTLLGRSQAALDDEAETLVDKTFGLAGLNAVPHSLPGVTGVVLEGSIRSVLQTHATQP